MTEAALQLELVPPRRPRMRRRVVGLASLGLAGYFAWVVVSDHAEIGRALVRFQGARLEWLLIAIACGVLSQVAGVLVQHRILERAGVDLGLPKTTAFVFAQGAISLAVPGGPVAANAYAFRQLRAAGADAPVAAWALTAVNVVGAIAVAGFSIFALTGVTPAGVVWLFFLCALFGGAVYAARSPERLRAPATAVVHVVRRLRRRPTGDAGEAAGAFVQRLSVIRLRRVDVSVTGALAIVSVIADCAVWLAATHAMITVPSRCLYPQAVRPLPAACAHVHIPTDADDLVAYASGQAANAIPLLPGGIGLVESAMTATLTARHIRPVPALSAVLLYRLVSYWAVIVVGAICWLILRRRPWSRAPLRI